MGKRKWMCQMEMQKVGLWSTQRIIVCSDNRHLRDHDVESDLPVLPDLLHGGALHRAGHALTRVLDTLWIPG